MSLPVLLLFWDSYSYKHFLLIPSNLKISQLICLDQVSRKLWYMKWVLSVCHVCRTYRIVKYAPFQSVPTTPHPLPYLSLCHLLNSIGGHCSWAFLGEFKHPGILSFVWGRLGNLIVVFCVTLNNQILRSYT